MMICFFSKTSSCSGCEIENYCRVQGASLLLPQNIFLKNHSSSDIEKRNILKSCLLLIILIDHLFFILFSFTIGKTTQMQFMFKVIPNAGWFTFSHVRTLRIMAFQMSNLLPGIQQTYEPKESSFPSYRWVFVTYNNRWDARQWNCCYDPPSKEEIEAIIISNTKLNWESTC